MTSLWVEIFSHLPNDFLWIYSRKASVELVEVGMDIKDIFDGSIMFSLTDLH